ncbi:hypothetical protein B0T44_03580 [Nocardia donostiensis]|uniref:Uncharacterized protein n=1 Tax=Nocardia donostiensis TaxID=1538463 RepID=A0A1W0BLC5_9NOCA|nr:hypothetical protein B0T46_11580 [Nocardia donostiensis]OQS16859.1 hypothetical protein B0T36_04255 [Nocardia donostiensis]OQS23324.1 hypothetical protein B0T44_03580 [Nocardia donostiensis]
MQPLLEDRKYGSRSATLDGGVLAAVVAAALDGIENGRLEALADDISVQAERSPAEEPAPSPSAPTRSV